MKNPRPQEETLGSYENLVQKRIEFLRSAAEVTAAIEAEGKGIPGCGLGEEEECENPKHNESMVTDGLSFGKEFKTLNCSNELRPMIVRHRLNVLQLMGVPSQV